MARVLFGTDGIRCRAGEYPLDPRTANALGAGLGKWVLESKKQPQVVIGLDPERLMRKKCRVNVVGVQNGQMFGLRTCKTNGDECEDENTDGTFHVTHNGCR